jgi:centrosomal CEP192-like protein
MLTPRQSANFNISFTPTAGSTSSGKVSVISNAYDSTLSVPLTGAGASTGILSANPTSNSFGSIQVGTSASQYQSVTNSGGSNVTVNQANVSGAGFSISGLTLPITLTPGQSYTFNTVFAPASSGAASGSIAVVSDASNSSLTIALSGTATASGQLLLSPTTLDFGSITVGQNKSLTAALGASGSSVTVSSASINNGEFSVSGASFPLTLNAGQSTPLTVTFALQSSGIASGNLSFSSNRSPTQVVEALSGTGVAQHQVQLSWAPSSSTE